MQAPWSFVNCGLKSKPSRPKNSFERFRSRTGRFTKSLRGWSIAMGRSLLGGSSGCSGKPLGLEVDGRPVAAVHVERHGLVLVRDAPETVDLAQADGRAAPEIALLAVGLGAVHAVEARAVGDVSAGGDLEVAVLVADRAAPGREPSRQSADVQAVRPERRSQRVVEEARGGVGVGRTHFLRSERAPRSLEHGAAPIVLGNRLALRHLFLPPWARSPSRTHLPGRRMAVSGRDAAATRRGPRQKNVVLASTNKIDSGPMSAAAPSRPHQTREEE